MKRICRLCNREFEPESPHQMYCKNTHTRVCKICNQTFELRNIDDTRACCSKSCATKLKEATWMEHYGVNNPAKAEVVKQKQAETCMERYGVPTPFFMDDFEEKAKNTCLARYGVENPLQDERFIAKRNQIIREKYNVDWPTQIPHVREAQAKAYKDPEFAKAAARKRSASIAKVVASDGYTLDSKFELQLYEFCLRNELKVEHQIPIEFEYQSEIRHTFIDFKIEGMFVEVKGSHLLSGLYDYADNMLPITEKLKIYQANHVILVTDSAGKPYIESYEGGKLIGVDIKIFNYSDSCKETWYKIIQLASEANMPIFITEDMLALQP